MQPRRSQALTRISQRNSTLSQDNDAIISYATSMPGVMSVRACVDVQPCMQSDTVIAFAFAGPGRAVLVALQGWLHSARYIVLLLVTTED